ncbi:FMN-binding protein [Cohnella ginsengisoli]|uniref:FMN-binding protein n=1 Tax=Cohnella ginsengisoli TaxID=425004 RepID=A0A9X4KKL1_9BACL|nr:FMN-binding protein [Cohnella ginsengisoli]MDG0793932.1 FMN-binding protein [Cohnella ginsengisoli]
MAKMKKKWIVLCSAAIGVIYASEYVASNFQAYLPQPRTRVGTDMQASGSLYPIGPTSTEGLLNAGNPIPSSSALPEKNGESPNAAANATPSADAPAKSPGSVNKRYNDGTYTGIGSNRRGSIQVAVTVKRDKITDVEISDFAMHYSESDVVDLPDQVLHKQSSQVDNVSGATYSTQAFEDAVADALAQAKIG